MLMLDSEDKSYTKFILGGRPVIYHLFYIKPASDVFFYEMYHLLQNLFLENYSPDFVLNIHYFLLKKKKSL